MFVVSQVIIIFHLIIKSGHSVWCISYYNTSITFELVNICINIRQYVINTTFSSIFTNP